MRCTMELWSTKPRVRRRRVDAQQDFPSLPTSVWPWRPKSCSMASGRSRRSWWPLRCGGRWRSETCCLSWRCSCRGLDCHSSVNQGVFRKKREPILDLGPAWDSPWLVSRRCYWVRSQRSPCGSGCSHGLGTSGPSGAGRCGRVLCPPAGR